jgi:hypothetical protein
MLHQLTGLRSTRGSASQSLARRSSSGSHLMNPRRRQFKVKKILYSSARKIMLSVYRLYYIHFIIQYFSSPRG